ncbi:MAG: DDE transposase family protein [Synechococcaceae cyanobacterium SM2_3_1]|nr:DDE transposase family protein [Synechococcaceae cyanobacterium SM2_3_1]
MTVSAPAPTPPCGWYIVQQTDETCQITTTLPVHAGPDPKIWGPFEQESEAIARRVGLIRSGQCLPV